LLSQLEKENENPDDVEEPKEQENLQRQVCFHRYIKSYGKKYIMTIFFLIAHIPRILRQMKLIRN
jgi:hypothetical protein